MQAQAGANPYRGHCFVGTVQEWPGPQGVNWLYGSHGPVLLPSYIPASKPVEKKTKDCRTRSYPKGRTTRNANLVSVLTLQYE